MKKSFYLLAFIFTITGAFAQVPQGMNYQGVLRNSLGDVLQNTNVCIQSTITDGSGGTVLYQETFDTTTNKFGLFTLSIGGGTPASGTFAAINWGGVNAWLTIDVKIACTGNYITMGSTQLLSVPYALYSKYSNNTPGTGFTNMQVFTADGMFTVPAGVTKIMIEAWGGGGGGGIQNHIHYAGGAGSYGKEIVAVIPATVYNIAIGQGGSGETSSSGTAPGVDGGATSVASLLSAGGGNGGYLSGMQGGVSTAAFNINGGNGASSNSICIGGNSPNGGPGGDEEVNINGKEPGGGGYCEAGNGANGRVIIWY